MYELVKLTEHCYYIESPVKIGLVDIGDANVVLIDSGNDKNTGKKVKRILEQNSWTLKAIYCTHSHADHIGGAKYLQTNTGCKVYAPGIECDFTNHPVLEPAFLYGGMPPKELRHKFLMAKECEAEPLTEDVLPEGFELIPLPGHSFDMVGIKTSENVYYMADCLSSKETLEKYSVNFLIDPGAFKETLEEVKRIAEDADTADEKLFIPAHTIPLDREEIIELTDFNIAKVDEIAEKITEIVSTPKTAEDVVAEVFETYDLKMTFEQNALLGCTIRSYLSWLEQEGKVMAEIDGNYVKWHAAL